jgi:hypothetical protein
MRIEQLLEQNKYNSQSILKESCDGLTLEQKRIVEGIYNEFVPLIEASLTADQITQIFSTVEKSATDAGSNRTMLGKAADVSGKVNDVINNVGKWLQDTTPVKMADQKFEQLKAKVGAKFPDLDKQLTGMGTWMKENPGKSAAIIGVLTALASLAGGPVGGAIAGQVLKGASELIKGEKLSTAVGKGLKAAAVGWLAGKSMEAVGKMIANAYEYFNPQPIHGFVQYYQENIGNGLPNIFRDAHIVGNKEQLGQFNQMWGSAAKQWQSGNFEGARDAFSQAQDFAIKITNDTYTAMGTTDPGEPIRKLKDLFVGLSAAAQGAATGAAGYDKQGKPVEAAKESYYRQSRPLSEGQVYLVFDRVVKLNEGPIWDKVKGVAGKAVGAVAQKAGQIGTNLTTKITADKLNSAWQKAGSPMDSEEVAAILKQAGVGDDIVGKVYTDLKLPAPGTSAETPAKSQTAYAQVKDSISKLNTKQRKQLMSMLQKQLGTT